MITLLAASAAAFASPAGAITQSTNVNVTVVKPLSLTALQSMDLGTLTLNGGTWTSAAVGISKAGVFSCNNTNVICSGAPQVARYKVTGANKQVVLISVPNVTLTNQNDSTQKLTLVADAPASITLTSSGEPGVNFDIGGSITLSSSTADGTYTGTMNVTVDYQ
jgi:hypothetical protein